MPWDEKAMASDKTRSAILSYEFQVFRVKIVHKIYHVESIH